MRDFFQKEISTARRGRQPAAACVSLALAADVEIEVGAFDGAASQREFEHTEVWDVVTRTVGWPECDDLIVVAKV